MSSLVGHLSAGVAVYLGHSSWSNKEERHLLPPCVLLAVLPDFDYFALWLFNVVQEPRFTHSLAFCLMTSAIAWFVLRLRHGSGVRTLVALSLASCSHPILDLLVGVHPVPIWWPFPVPEFQSPIGLLPSAGHLNPANYYLWRNLLIECGVLLPTFAFLVAVSRAVPIRASWPIGAILLPIWVAFLSWSIHVHS